MPDYSVDQELVVVRGGLTHLPKTPFLANFRGHHAGAPRSGGSLGFDTFLQLFTLDPQLTHRATPALLADPCDTAGLTAALFHCSEPHRFRRLH